VKQGGAGWVALSVFERAYLSLSILLQVVASLNIFTVEKQRAHYYV
jgi:hypothetical protein